MDDTAVVLTRHKLDADDFYRMAETGILGEKDRVELIGGDVIDMAPIGQDDVGVLNALTRALVLACGDRAIVSAHNSMHLDGLNVPQPDFAIFRPRADFYVTGERPGPAQMLLLVEVADSSLHYDRTVKLPLYARAEIAEYWIVDLKRRVLDAFRGPSGDGYREVATYQAGEKIALALTPEIVVKLDLVFG